MRKIIDQIELMSPRGKITLLIIFVVMISIIFACTYSALAKEGEPEKVEAPKNEVKTNVVALDPSSIEFVNEIDEDTNTVNEVEEENTVEENVVVKEVTHKGKTVKVPKAEVAAANSKEDSQVKKTGGESTSAEEAVNKFENDGQSVGIDVSAHQGRIDWAQVKASGIEFAMIRCGFRGYTEGKIYEDAYFKSNINGAVNNGIMVGIYFYSVAMNEEEALQEAAWVVERIKSYRITYPVVYDFEDFNRGRTAGISGEQATANANTFLNYIASQGYTPMMYASKNDISNRFNKGNLNYKFWLAHYTSETDYTGSYQMWQYTSKGSVAGINGNTDMNVAYFRYGAVAEPKHTHDFANGTEIRNKTKQPTCTEAGEKYIRCKDCSESERQEIPALGHGQYKKLDSECKAPTCTEKGREVTKCERCDDRKVTETPALGHNFKNGKVVPNAEGSKPATCKETGIKVVQCARCSATEKQSIPKTAHDFTGNSTITEATCTQKGEKIVQCKNCTETKKEELPLKAHSFGEYVTVTEATTEAEGEEVRTCSVCGAKEARAIPKKEAPVTPPEPEPTPTPTPTPEPEPESPDEEEFIPKPKPKPNQPEGGDVEV